MRSPAHLYLEAGVVVGRADSGVAEVTARESYDAATIWTKLDPCTQFTHRLAM